MRTRKTDRGFVVQATAGTYVVMIGISLRRSQCTGLMGFAIHKTDHDANEAGWLRGIKTFEETDPGFEPGFRYPTNEHPVQGFAWSDFEAVPGRRYTYRVLALKGSPSSLRTFRELTLTVRTEAEEDGLHDIYFNSGASGSQAYSRLFGNTRPDLGDADDPRWRWLSRGAYEGLAAFLERAADDRWDVRVAAYEFRLPRFARLLRAAKDRGANVRVVYDGNANPPKADGVVFPRDLNHDTARAARIKSLCIDRLTKPANKTPPIAHNKFIVLVRNGTAQAVLTGSANFSEGGLFGQSNVLHVVENRDVAAEYLEYWNILAGNPDHDELRDDLTARNGPFDGAPPSGTTTIFSPQRPLDALSWYAEQAQNARDALFMTFAFGMNNLFKDVYRTADTPLRYALMDKLIPPGTRREQRPAKLREMARLRFMEENRITVGNRIITGTFDRWLRETLTGLNRHVQFIHTKFMLIDPLSNDPTVVTGSANFSDASTRRNDENMMVIRGNRRVADVYLGEYMRLWNHYAFRDWLANRPPNSPPTPRHLDVTDTWWERYFGTTDRSRQRAYFSGS